MLERVVVIQVSSKRVDAKPTDSATLIRHTADLAFVPSIDFKAISYPCQRAKPQTRLSV
jgi:hypothetical protein